jgi:hypothetical protein
MDREAFERLVSAWLDEPARNDLRTQLEAAVRAAPELAATCDAWRRVADLLRQPPPVLERVDWGRVRAGIDAALDEVEAGADARLDVLLTEAPALARVDWTRLHGRISAAVVHDQTAVLLRRRGRWALGVASGVAAAAAGLFLAFRPGAAPALAPSGTVAVVLAQPAVSDRGTVIAKISAPPTVAAQPAEFFTVDPVGKAHAGEVAGYF